MQKRSIFQLHIDPLRCSTLILSFPSYPFHTYWLLLGCRIHPESAHMAWLYHLRTLLSSFDFSHISVISQTFLGIMTAYTCIWPCLFLPKTLHVTWKGRGPSEILPRLQLRVIFV